MEIEKIKELINMMKENDLNELEIVDGQTRIMLRRGPGQQVVPQVVAMPSVIGAGAPGAAGEEKASESARENTKGPVEVPVQENLVEIVSPLVGTFYATPSPNADPFVEAGKQVDEETVVCIIEAMKVMNEIKSEIKGTIKQVLVSNGQAVEYGQSMFLVEPA